MGGRALVKGSLGSASPSLDLRVSHLRAEPGALCRNSRLLKRWRVGGFPDLAAREFAGLPAGCSTVGPRAAPPLPRPALAERRDPEPWGARHPQLGDRLSVLRAPSAPAYAPPDHSFRKLEVRSHSKGRACTEPRETRRAG